MRWQERDLHIQFQQMKRVMIDMASTKKMISWNVNGLRAAVTKGFLDFFRDIDADIFCIQESKLSEGQIELDLPGYYDYWNYAQKRLLRCSCFYKR